MTNTKIAHLIAISLTCCLVNLAFANTADTYTKTCGTCHETGALNAPKKGDKALWDKLITQKSMAKLVQATKDGLPQMPAKGLCNHCTDDEFVALIEHMAK